MTGIGIIGCGFVADYYAECLKNYPHLKVLGVTDKDLSRATKFGAHYGYPVIRNTEELLKNANIDLVLVLTNPRSHYEISRQCLLAGKHVYSEKPLAMDLKDAEDLVELAEKLKLQIVSAPCNVLSESAQTMWKAIRDDKIGSVKLVYAEMDDGPIHLMRPENWRSATGTPWPVKDEYEVGCTLEHAGYYVTWLAAFFGPAKTVTAFSTTLQHDKRCEVPLDPPDTPDFSVACIEFESGVVARLTCGIMAPHDHKLEVVGETGILSVDECWHYGDPVRHHKYSSLAFRAERYSWIRRSRWLSKLFGLSGKKLPFVKNPGLRKRLKRDYMDYARGVDELASAIKEGRTCRMSPRFSLHVNEIVLAIQNASNRSCTYQVKNQFKPLSPLP